MPGYSGRTTQPPETGPSAYPNHKESQKSRIAVGGFDSFRVFLDELMNIHAPVAS